MPEWRMSAIRMGTMKKKRSKWINTKYINVMITAMSLPWKVFFPARFTKTHWCDSCFKWLPSTLQSIMSGLCNLHIIARDKNKYFDSHERTSRNLRLPHDRLCWGTCSSGSCKACWEGRWTKYHWNGFKNYKQSGVKHADSWIATPSWHWHRAAVTPLPGVSAPADLRPSLLEPLFAAAQPSLCPVSADKAGQFIIWKI